MPNNNNNTNFTLIVVPSDFFLANNGIAETEELEILGQDLASSADLVDGGVFKEIYPEVKTDETTGERYRVISEVTAFQSVQQKHGAFNLDVLAIEEGIRDLNGEKQGAYLFTTPGRKVGTEQVERVFLDAHAAFNPTVQDEIILSPGMPTLVFLGPHEKKLKASVISIDNSYAEVSFAGITLTSKQARDDFNAVGYKAITGTSTIGAVRNYGVGKYKQEPGDTGERHYFETVIAYMHLLRKQEGAFDLLELRKKGPRLKAHNLIQIAQERGYGKIVLAFCRSPYQVQEKKQSRVSYLFHSFKQIIKPSTPKSGEPEVYKAIDTELLEQPLFYSWDDIRKLEIDKRCISKNEAELSSILRMPC